jgi:transcriptional regulator NrdR family protein
MEKPMNSTVSTLPREVIKRSGQRAAFDAEKIRSALERAGTATGEFAADEAALLAAQASC